MVRLEAEGRARGERFPEGACCEGCGRRGTLRGSAFCADCRETLPGASGGDCDHCGHPLILVSGGWDRRCLNHRCPPAVLERRIVLAIIAASFAYALIVWLR